MVYRGVPKEEGESMECNETRRWYQVCDTEIDIMDNAIIPGIGTNG